MLVQDYYLREEEYASKRKYPLVNTPWWRVLLDIHVISGLDTLCVFIK